MYYTIIIWTTSSSHVANLIFITCNCWHVLLFLLLLLLTGLWFHIVYISYRIACLATVFRTYINKNIVSTYSLITVPVISSPSHHQSFQPDLALTTGSCALFPPFILLVHRSWGIDCLKLICSGMTLMVSSLYPSFELLLFAPLVLYCCIMRHTCLSAH